MPDKQYTFGCTFNVIKREHCTMTDMEFAQLVLILLKMRLASSCDKHMAVFDVDSIHPIMVGPEGGTNVEP